MCVGGWVDWLRIVAFLYVTVSTFGPSIAIAITQAHRHATAAEEARRAGRLQESLQEHLEATRCFLEAAERLPDVNGVVRLVVVYRFMQPRLALPSTGGFDLNTHHPLNFLKQTGAALVLLSDGHARQAKTLQQVLRRSGAGGNGATKARKRPLPTPLLQQQQPQQPPPPSGSPPPPPGSSSMYASALGPEGNKERAWAAQVDDMLALEKRLQAIGSQPVFSGAGSFVHASSAHPHDGGGGGGGGHGPRYLSSTLGDSFFLVSNRCVSVSCRWGRGVGVPTSCVTCVLHAHIDVITNKHDPHTTYNKRHAANREAAWGDAGGGGSALLGSSSRMPPPSSGATKGSGGGLRMDAAAAAALRGSRQGAVGGGGGSNAGAGAGGRGGGGLPRAASSTSLASGGGSGAMANTATSTGAAGAGGRPPAGVGAASASASVSSAGSGGPRGFLDGVESVQQGEVMRLLGCMKTLGDENAVLIRQVEDGARIKQENERLRRELAEFRELYNSRVGVHWLIRMWWCLEGYLSSVVVITEALIAPIHPPTYTTTHHSSSSSAPRWRSSGSATRTSTTRPTTWPPRWTARGSRRWRRRWSSSMGG